MLTNDFTKPLNILGLALAATGATTFADFSGGGAARSALVVFTAASSRTNERVAVTGCGTSSLSSGAIS